jgi:hypothetical protein
MRRRSFLYAGLLAAGLALGIVAAPALGGAASAQTQPPGAAQAATGDTLRTLFLDKLAATLGIQRSALDSALTSAGVGAVDTAVQQGTLMQAQADAIKARVQAGDVGALLGGHGPGGPGGPGRGPIDAGVHQAMFDAAAKALGITSDELKTQLRSRQTLAQLAQAHGTTEQAVVDAALAAAKTQLAQAVSGGTLTQAQADTIYAELQQRGGDLLAGPGPGRGPGGRHGGRSPAQPAAPTPATGQGA